MMGRFSSEADQLTRESGKNVEMEVGDDQQATVQMGWTVGLMMLEGGVVEGGRDDRRWRGGGGRQAMM